MITGGGLFHRGPLAACSGTVGRCKKGRVRRLYVTMTTKPNDLEQY